MASTTKKSVEAKEVVKKPMKKTEKVEKTEVVEAKIATATPKATKGLSIDVIDVKGAKTSMTLPEEVFGATINKTLLKQAIRVYLANQRTGTASSKNRGEVTGSTRKIYQQKGTGRARHGGIRAPIFVGGGVTHGPRPHDFSLTMPKKMRKLALFSALTSKKIDGAIMVVKGLETLDAKTKIVVQTFAKIGVSGKNIMVVTPVGTEKMGSITKSARNIAHVTLMPVTRLNAYEVLKAQTVVFMQEAIPTLTESGKEK